MKITIELFHDELLPHQRGALAVLLNPVAPKPLRDTVSVRGEERDLSEFVPGGDDIDARVVEDWTAPQAEPASIKRSELLSKVAAGQKAVVHRFANEDSPERAYEGRVDRVFGGTGCGAMFACGWYLDERGEWAAGNGTRVALVELDGIPVVED